MRTLAIGDIHGCRKALETLAALVKFTAEDTIVTLGDSVDRGPDSFGVIEFLIELAGTARLIPLRGNHEIMMLEARQSRRWIHPVVGGDSTLESYEAASFNDIPQAHWRFLEGCLPYHETENHLFVHACLDPSRSLDDQSDAMLYWERLPRRPVQHCSGKILVCGHTPQGSGHPLSFGHTVCIDTDAWNRGWLTCLDVGTGRYWQANEKGQTRTEVLKVVRRNIK